MYTKALTISICALLGLLAADVKHAYAQGFSTFPDGSPVGETFVRLMVNTTFTGTAIEFDNLLFFPPMDNLQGDLTEERMAGINRTLITNSLQITHTENVSLLIKVDDGIVIGDNLFPARDIRTSALWLNDGSRNPGMANMIESRVFNELQMFDKPMLIRDFDEWRNTLSAYLILETEVNNPALLAERMVVPYTIDITIEYE